MHLRGSYLAWPNFIDFFHAAQDTLNPTKLFKSVYGVHLSRKSDQVGGRQRSCLDNPDIVPLDICVAGGQDILPNARRQLRDPPWARGTAG